MVDAAPSSGGFIVPKIDDIHKKLYAAVTQPKALDMGTWHTCETTHCRAGWVVHLAGDAGYALEQKTTTLFAAQQIYKASGYDISPVRFYDSNDKAMADMRALAGE
jgi:predicted metal-dependent hydrolase